MLLKKMMWASFVSAFLIGAASLPAAPVDIAGVWILTMQTPQGEMPAETTFTLEKDVLKVSMQGPQGMEMKGEGKIKDADVEWTLTVSTPQGDFTLQFKGKVEGETMKGEVQMGDFGTSQFTGKKKK
jgi:hypothetical protein